MAADGQPELLSGAHDVIKSGNMEEMLSPLPVRKGLPIPLKAHGLPFLLTVKTQKLSLQEGRTFLKELS